MGSIYGGTLCAGKPITRQKGSDSLPRAPDNRTSHAKSRINNLSGGDERGLMVVTHYFFSTVNYGELIMTDTTNTATPKVAKLNEQSQIAFKKWSSDTVNADLNKKQRLETLRQQGWKSTMFISPKSAGSTATITLLKSGNFSL